VTLRQTVSLYFGRLVGKNDADISASARSVLIPRDIALVVDLSGSMNDDSEIRHYLQTGVNLNEVWQALGDGTGPTYGLMNNWGSDLTVSPYLIASDTGLVRLPFNTNWTTPLLGPPTDALLNQLPYNLLERTAIKTRNPDTTTGTDANTSGAIDPSESLHWRNRVGAILGLAEWHSGKGPDALGASAGYPGVPAGNGDDVLDNNEMVWIDYPYTATGIPPGSWQDWIGNYMSASNSEMVNANAFFRYRFGLKTFVNYLLEARSRNDQTDVLWDTPEQPLQAVKDAVGEIVDIMQSIDSGDRLSLTVFATTAQAEEAFTDDFAEVRETLRQRQSNHYDDATCIGCGLEFGRNELLANGRPGATKMMVMLTDGIANVTEDGTVVPDGANSDAESYVLDQADAARQDHVKIYAVSVGQGDAVDQELLQQVAQMTEASSFHAEGSIAEYTEQLRQIFRTIGGKRSAVLIR
jgi:Mg-chelatase subunit ChlD